MIRSLWVLAFLLISIQNHARCLKGNCNSGSGTYLLKDGSKYIGDFKRNKFHGKGILYYANGAKYLGSWSSGKRNGKGKYIFSKGGVYLGEFKSGKMHGTGTFTFKTGETYSGEFAYNQIEGKGSYHYANGELYEGQFKQGKYHGFGEFEYSDGQKYKGYWISNKRNGYGILYAGNKAILAGKWFDDRISKKMSKEVVSGYLPQNKIDQVVQAQATSVEFKENKNNGTTIWAVIIGISNYDHMPQLKFTDDDAYRLYAFLKSPEGGALKDDQIELLIDEQASKKNILTTIENSFSKADSNDMVLLYYSGHGINGALIPVDYNGISNKINYQELNEIISRSKAKHKICLADACYSGSYVQARGDLNQSLSSYYKKFENINASTTFFLSSEPDQVSLEYPKLRQGVFTHFLLQGLNGKADSNQDRTVTVKELFAFVSYKVKTFTKQKQTPVLSGLYDMDMPMALVR